LANQWLDEAEGEVMAFWFFKCNPEQYRLAARLADPNPNTSWMVTRYRDEIGPGDTVFI
jgi:hypothetical protein